MNAPTPYAQVTHDGRLIDQRTRFALLEAEQHLGRPLNLTQGSYNAGGVSASAGTHDGGGVVDGVEDSLIGYNQAVAALRRVGFAAWYRPELWHGSTRVWPAHWHAVQIGNRKLSPAARAQVWEYLAGYDGLAGNGLDTGPRQYVDHRFSWRAGAGRINRARGLVERADALLATGVRGYPRAGKARAQLREALGTLPRPVP